MTTTVPDTRIEVGSKCAESACDQFQERHAHEPDEPPLHTIAFSTVELSKSATAGEKWRLYVTSGEDGYAEGELSRLIADAAAARALMRDLNRAQH